MSLKRQAHVITLLSVFALAVGCGGETSEITYNPSHHAAEGIVSDDIWTMVDDLLVSMDSPHMLLDFDQMTTDDDMMVTTLTVDTSVADEIVTMLEGASRGQLEITETTLGGGVTELIVSEDVGARVGYSL